MVIQCVGDTAAVAARLEALSREWRESSLPAEFRAHGIYHYTLTRRGPEAFVLHVRLPGRHRFTCAAEIALIATPDGTILRCAPRLDPRLSTACALYASLMALAAVALTWGAGIEPSAVAVAAAIGLALACLAYGLASRAMPPVTAGIAALLRRASDEPGERVTA
jgi:hypothetical protein